MYIEDTKKDNFKMLVIICGIFLVCFIFTIKINFNWYIVPFFFVVTMSFLSVTSTSLIYALIFLMLTYLGSVFILFCIVKNFIAISLLFIYVGAIAILFLFVVMTLSSDRITQQVQLNYFDKFCLFLYFCFIFFCTFILAYPIAPFQVFYRWSRFNKIQHVHFVSGPKEDIIDIGLLLYGVHTFAFFVVVLILFLGFICPIVLTLNEHEYSYNKK